MKYDTPAPLLVDSLDELSQKDLEHVTVTYLVEAFAATTNEIALQVEDWTNSVSVQFLHQ